jgi:hypothetical protein
MTLRHHMKLEIPWSKRNINSPWDFLVMLMLNLMSASLI